MMVEVDMSTGSSSCRPPSGSTYLTIGQDLFSIQEYVTEQYNRSLHEGRVTSISDFVPAVGMVYTDIQTLRGLHHPVDYGSGMEFANGILDLYHYESSSSSSSSSSSNDDRSRMGLQIGLWLNGTTGCHDINTGVLDDQVDALIQYLSHTRARKVFLRIGYEFDNPDFHYDDPLEYKHAFLHIVNQCRLQHDCVSKVEFVWHSWAAKGMGPLEDYYPGSRHVDWIGVSIFDQYFPWNQRKAVREDIVHVLDFAKIQNKPIMIAESTPFGGIDLQDTITAPYNVTNAWDRWFQPTIDLIDEYDIAMWSYINCDWESQPMWHNVGFGETRLSTNQLVMKQWQEQVLHNPRFLQKLQCDSTTTTTTMPSQEEESKLLLGTASVASFNSNNNNKQEEDAAATTNTTTVTDDWYGALWLLIVISSVICLYLWRSRDDQARARAEEQRRETQELMRMIRYGSTT